MSITRKVVNKEVVYTVDDGFAAVIDDQHMLLIVYPDTTLTRPHARALEKLLAKAKARDGVKGHLMYCGHVMCEEGGEMIIRPKGD